MDTITTRHGLLALWCATLAVGFAVLQASPFGEPRGEGFAFWSWLFGVSGCAQLLALAAESRWTGVPVFRVAFAIVGLVSWGQLAWLLLESVAATALQAAGGIGVCVVVALTELHSIYQAASDARVDHP